MSVDTCTFNFSTCCETTAADFDLKYPTLDDRQAGTQHIELAHLSSQTSGDVHAWR